MNYNQMAKEYEISAKNISEKLKTLKAEKANSHGGELKNLIRRIKILESMYIDCDFTAKVLRTRVSQKNCPNSKGGVINEK